MRAASAKAKKAIWNEIYNEYKKNVQQAKTLAQIKNKLKNLEKEYKSVKGRMDLTGREGALKIKEECEFFDDIDEFLGHRDAVGITNMHLESSLSLNMEKKQQESGDENRPP